mmetsp:Transcript_9873/g.14932  ORF Transcript_9873/g.14932 Transcript_9873/m.14932 type:complete len:167 (-) Transcript_9873:457-957(-)|eukprot:CAMPEP_0196134092 /NCGR_PEP_ID=MMETSP0910-20130528/3068_1 /TAXON_ID=49265 /ORGANISM="Thalassiosira rotula, Strain GSO102" /LENGTH=166 /DNA_ID=CAMNT_0041393893 /DNA_START=96 /DNA_END=596 /DNA_ORIENTATION=+
MDKYRLVEEKFIGAQGFIDDTKDTVDVRAKGDIGEIGGCIVRITQQAKPRSCITTAMNMLASGNKYVELKAMGKAINKAVTIAEILKRKMPLHQITALSSCEIVNVYEPLEEGLDTVVNQHYVSCLTITLSTDLTGIDVHNIGYQPPLSLSEMQPGDHHGKAVAAT